LPDLTVRLRVALAHPSSSVGFDLMAALEDVLQDVGLSIADAGGRVSHLGADPVLKSPLRIGGAATIGLLAKSVAAAALHRALRSDAHASVGSGPSRQA
jgi:hypothetical protein